MNRKTFYTVLVIMMTAASITTMLYTSGVEYGSDSAPEKQPVSIINNEDREYLGYIFDDYNKQVNLSYVDKERKVSADKNNSTEDTSLNVMTTGNTISIHDFDNSINLDDKVELLNIMRKLDQNGIIQFKRLFDRQTGESEVLKIMKVLKENMVVDDYGKLSGIFDKYREILNTKE